MSRSSSGYGVVGWATIEPVGVGAAEPITMVRPAGAGAVGVAGADEEIEGEEAVDAGEFARFDNGVPSARCAGR